MARFEVTVSEMQNAASKIQQAAESFMEAANQVFAGAQALADSWEGDSQVAFVEEQQRANDWYKKMVEIVNTYVAGLNKAAQDYAKADSDAASEIRKR